MKEPTDIKHQIKKNRQREKIECTVSNRSNFKIKLKPKESKWFYIKFKYQVLMSTQDAT